MASELVGVTWNIMMPLPEPIRFTGQRERLERIPPAVLTELDPLARVDFVAVQESLVQTQHDALSDAFRAAGFAYATRQINGSLRDLKIVPGGVVLFSRVPIVAQQSCVFEGQCAREDCLASKGAVYAQLNKAGRVYHVFATHMQAWESFESRAVRRGQTHELARFVQAQRIPAGDPVVLLGDFNVDLYSERVQLASMEAMLGFDVLARHRDSHPFTSDPLTNQLVGLDDPASYASDAYPGGCADEYMRSLHCVCCPQEWLDHAMVSRAHLGADMSASWMRAVPVKSAPFAIDLTMTMRREIADLSDHYPVLARFVFGAEPQSTSAADGAEFSIAARESLVPRGGYLLIGGIVALGVAVLAAYLIWAGIRGRKTHRAA